MALRGLVIVLSVLVAIMAMTGNTEGFFGRGRIGRQRNKLTGSFGRVGRQRKKLTGSVGRVGRPSKKLTGSVGYM